MPGGSYTMLTDQEMLQYIDHSTKTKYHEINQILPYVTDSSLRHMLKDQQIRYQLYRSEASKLFSPCHKGISNSFTNSAPIPKISNSPFHHPSYSAKQMLHLSLSELLQLQNHLHEYHAGDPRIHALAEKQVDLISQCIQQIRPFL